MVNQSEMFAFARIRKRTPSESDDEADLMENIKKKKIL